MQHVYDINTPIGMLAIIEDDGAVTRVLFGGAKDAAAGSPAPTPLLAEAERQFREYFGGIRKTFSLPLRPEGPPFHQKVWDALMQIPYGETRSYKDIAEAAGCPRGYRAAGMANNKNVIPIIIPCHRVIGSDKSLTGYGGGIGIKKALLELEAEISGK